MSVDHRRFSAILGGPVVAHRQSELIGFARRLAVEAELADCTGTAAVHFFAQTGMRDHQSPVVEHVMADKAVEERCEFASVLGR